MVSEKIQENIKLPIIDLSLEKSQILKLIVKASEEFGFFKVINHGVDTNVIKKMEDESYNFFSKSFSQKQCAGPANPYGYGCKNIGFNGDNGEVEYLLLHANPNMSISQISKNISSDPLMFSCAVNGYVKSVRELACKILELMAQGLRVQQTSVYSNLLMDLHSDSLLRINHYPPFNWTPHLLHHDCDTSPNSCNSTVSKIGFGEHTDPQILTILRSNDAPGLQISTQQGLWVPVSPHPNTAFSIFVGDTLQALTNGRFKSVRHRAMVNSCKPRMSMVYFGAPSPHARICCPLELVTTTPHKPYHLYRPFTWGEYKKATYSMRLGDTRLDQFFRLQSENDETITINNQTS
ncbi:gibberellin 2-oxidase [Solanum lycopersicum]|uniref:gibberellin 2beta-dioxygenase n=1 Tax=Solanum lycopersicum TaxID=4081 RepID=A4GVL5_SOLLC|nr:gibberellin 2-oxidase [Solanum lycopersicum]ABO27632.1 gibberellin 2-oxidase [Solanum lycopersicum]